MQLHQVIQTGLTFAQQNPIMAAVAGIVFLFLLTKWPRILLTLSLVAFGFLFAMHFYDKFFGAGFGGK